MSIDKFILEKDKSLLLIVDVQEKFLPHIDKSESLIKKTDILMKAANRLDIPVLITEQYPKGLGYTQKKLLNNYSGKSPIQKDTFSCCKEPSFMENLKKINRSHIVLTGIESHVCVLQTALDLLKEGYSVHAARDCMRSRHPRNRRAALELMQQAGIVITCLETIIFQWLDKSGTAEFKDIQPLIK